MKCDEEHPSCRRCIAFGVSCDGYAHLAKSQSAQAVQAVQARPLLVNQRALEPKRYHQPESLTNLHSGPRFTDQLEARYFHYYCTKIAGDIAANCRSPIWNRIIPQAGETEGFIGHGVAALGALSLAEKKGRGWDGGRGMRLDTHYQYALVQYCKALKMMQEGLWGKIWGRTRTSLVRIPRKPAALLNP